jgi:hypothetical protein
MLNTQRNAEIGLGAATFLEIGLASLQDGDVPRAAGAFMSINAEAWQEIVNRLPGLAEWVRDVIGQCREGVR